MKNKTTNFSIWAAVVCFMLISAYAQTWTDYTLGSLCVTTCAAPGIILDDLTTCYWDPNKCKTSTVLTWKFITRLNHKTFSMHFHSLLNSWFF